MADDLLELEGWSQLPPLRDGEKWDDALAIWKCCGWGGCSCCEERADDDVTDESTATTSRIRISPSGPISSVFTARGRPAMRDAAELLFGTKKS